MREFGQDQSEQKVSDHSGRPAALWWLTIFPFEPPDVTRGRSVSLRDLAVSTELETERDGLKEEEGQQAELRLVIGRLEEFAEQMRAGLETRRPSGV